MNKWDKRFMGMAKEIATWSKDPSKQIGCIIVDDNRQILSQGYNGFPRGIKDLGARYASRPTKYIYIVHAEMNAIYNATYNGVSLSGGTAYVYGLPTCSECAKGLIQVGVKRVVMGLGSRLSELPPVWQKSWNDTESMFTECGIEHEFDI